MAIVAVPASLQPAALFNECYHPLFKFISLATGAPTADIEDLVQDVLLDAWRRRDRFRGEASPLTWVISIARHKIHDRWRRAGRTLRALSRLAEEPVPPELLHDDGLRAAVRRALDRLDPSYADLLERRYFDDCSVAAIAAALDDSEKAVESRLHRARVALRDELTRGDDHDE